MVAQSGSSSYFPQRGIRKAPPPFMMEMSKTDKHPYFLFNTCLIQALSPLAMFHDLDFCAGPCGKTQRKIYKGL
jgi:hypothetical protein